LLKPKSKAGLNFKCLTLYETEVMIKIMKIEVVCHFEEDVKRKLAQHEALITEIKIHKKTFQKIQQQIE